MQDEADEVRRSVQAFLALLEKREGFWSVKELCRFLLGQENLFNREKTASYVSDYLEVVRCRQRFHKRWSARGVREMDAVLRYEGEEVKFLQALLSEVEGRPGSRGE